jgi:DNA helicase HerA-like ATPase
VRDIVAHIDSGQTVIVDLSNADETVARHYTELISKQIFWSQSAKFGEGRLGDHSVLFYFEEAHNLFRHDDSDLRSIYNRIAKEGAKYRIGMVYATQSMTTLSPDLLKNTENFFIAHLNDDREITELTKKYEFRDMGLDVQRCKRRGYVRMITLSHRYALPVQVRKFGQEQEEV